MICSDHNGSRGTATIVEVNSETDFLALNKDFQTFVATLCHTVNQYKQCGPLPVEEVLSLAPFTTASTGTDSSKKSTLRDMLGDLVAAIRENIVVRRVLNLSEEDRRLLTGYVHGKVRSIHRLRLPLS